MLRVVRHSARDTKRDPRESWFIWVFGAVEAGVVEGSEAVEPVPVPLAEIVPLPLAEIVPLPLAEIVPLYGLRFSLEHGFRFEKQSLLWDKPRLRRPEQFDQSSLTRAV